MKFIETCICKMPLYNYKNSTCGRCNRIRVTVLAVNTESSINEKIDHPEHYNSINAKCSCGKKIECIDIVRNFSFSMGNAIKYLWRADFKGQPLEDLKKALWYIQDEINRRENNE